MKNHLITIILLIITSAPNLIDAAEMLSASRVVGIDGSPRFYVYKREIDIHTAYTDGYYKVKSAVSNESGFSVNGVQVSEYEFLLAKAGERKTALLEQSKKSRTLVAAVRTDGSRHLPFEDDLKKLNSLLAESKANGNFWKINHDLRVFLDPEYKTSSLGAWWKMMRK